MNKTPYFSVVIPLYNKEKYIKKTIQSVLNQTYKNFEIIVVDDGSTDNSYKIVESINDSRIRLIVQENGGPSKARNKGVKEAKGEFIAFLDADDEWYKEKLDLQYNFHLNNKNINWSCTAFDAIGGKRDERIIYTKNGLINDVLYEIINGLVIQTSTVVIRKIIFNNKDIYFNEYVKRSEDRELWLKMGMLYPNLGYINNPSSIYRVESVGSLSSSGLDEMDFSFLSLPDRLKDVLSKIETKRKEKLLLFFEKYNKKKILTIWGWTDLFLLSKESFKRHVSSEFLKILEYGNFLPKIIKKTIVKSYLIITK